VKRSARRSRWLPLVALVMLAGCARLSAAPSGVGVGGATDTGLVSAEPSVFKDYADGSPGYTPFGDVPAEGMPCAKAYSAARCDALAIGASDSLGVGFDQVRSILIVPNPSPVQIDFAHRTFLAVTLDDGTTHSVVISCPGISGAFDPPCMLDPKIPVGGPGGLDRCCYTDIPGDATPVPSANPAATSQSRALGVPRLVIPITRLGPQTMEVGRATLPNGLLRDGTVDLAEPWSFDVHFRSGILLVVTPVAGGPPLTNVYEHGWREGVEEVVATLTFDVTWFKPGASITAVNLVVR